MTVMMARWEGKGKKGKREKMKKKKKSGKKENDRPGLLDNTRYNCTRKYKLKNAYDVDVDSIGTK